MSLSSLNKFGDAAMLLLRLVIGAVFIGHGMMKFGSFAQPAEGMNIVMMILAVAEPIGGAALILGALTRWAALGLSIVMVGAIYMKQFVWGGAFMGAQMAWELDAVILGALLVVACYGAGRLSVDAMMRKS
jgi:putative oxidoreductase